MAAIHGRRILIVEDNALVGEHIADVLRHAGAIPLGPLCTAAEAHDALSGGAPPFDAAIVDMQLDEPSDGIADRLDRMQVPFVFATANRAAIPHRHKARPVCEKPFTAQALLDALRSVFPDPPGAQVIPIDAARRR